MKFKHSMVLGLSALVVSGATVLPVSEVQGAELSLGFQTFNTPDFVSKPGRPMPKRQVKRTMAQIKQQPFKAKAPVAKLQPKAPKLEPMVVSQAPHHAVRAAGQSISRTGRFHPRVRQRLISKRHAPVHPIHQRAQSASRAHAAPVAQAAPQPAMPIAMGGPELPQEPTVNKPILQLAQMNVPDENNRPRTSSRRGAGNRRSRGAMAKAKKVNRAPTAVPFAINSSLKKDTLVLQSGISASLSEVDITIGRSKVVDLQAPVARVSISDPEVASAVIISPTQIQLIGKRVGVANLVLWDDETSSRYTILDIAVHRDVSVLAKQLKFLDPGIRVEPLAAQNSVVLSGDAQTAESAQLAVELAKAFFAQQGRGGAGGGAGAGGGGAAAGGGAGAGGAGGAAGGGGNQAQAISSLAPGSSLPLSSPRVINMIKVAGRPSTKLELARTKLKELDPNIRMDIVPGDGGAEKVILTGRVATAGTISKAINTASVFYGTPGMRVITGPGGKMIRPTGTADFQPANAFNDNLDINILQGSIVTDSSGNVISMMEVAQKPQVRCSIRFLNVQRAALAQLGGSLLMSRRDFALGSYSAGLNPLAGRTIVQQGGGSSYAATATGNYRGVPNPASKVVTEAVNLTQTLGTGVTQAFTINQTILGAISALEDRRKLRSLAEPTLTLLSGEKASFLAGGEVPIPVLGTNGQITINYHEFGIRLNLIATVTDDNKIHMQVAPEVSTVDPTNSITSNLVTVPGFATRRMQTTLEMVNGESFILAGLYSQEDSDNISRFPGIGQIPIIGTFFSGKNRDRRDNEMIVIIRPEIIMSPEAGATTTPVGNNPLKAPGQKFSKEILGLADTK